MASTTLTDSSLDTDPVKARLLSLSHVSHPGSPIDSPNAASPHIPATPVNTSATASPAPEPATVSPTLLSPPANTPENGLDSGIASPSENTARLHFHPPDFLKTHHFYSPILSPTAPPNSPDDWRITTSMDTAIEPSNANFLQPSIPQKPDPEEVNDEKGNTESDLSKVPVDVRAANDLYEVRSIPGKGYGCFATRTLKRGTRILADKPLLIVPVAEYYESDIKEPFSKLSKEEQALYFSLHSAHGQNPENWPKHIHPLVSSREKCRIEEQHNARVAKEPSLVSIFQTNCMELDGGAAIFPNAARFNHSCNPNACFTWNPAIGKETIHAMRDIEKDEEITLSYCDIMHDKASRRWELKHYGFSCDCPACSGDESDPESFAAKSAANRYRLMEIDEEYTKVQQPGNQVRLSERMLEMIMLLRKEGDNSGRLGRVFVDLALVCEVSGDLPHARESARLALKTMLEAQGPDHPDIQRYAGLLKRLNKRIEEERREGHEN